MRKNFLGIDYGDKRVGLALAKGSDLALPFKVLQNDKDLLTAIEKIAKEEEIDIVVVGLPHSFSGQENERLSKTKDFVDRLIDNLEIQVDTVDEQLTSKLYEKMGVKKDIDKHAASAILDSYLKINAR